MFPVVLMIIAMQCKICHLLYNFISDYVLTPVNCFRRALVSSTYTPTIHVCSMLIRCMYYCSDAFETTA
jgi:hypothetical protein